MWKQAIQFSYIKKKQPILDMDNLVKLLIVTSMYAIRTTNLISVIKI